MKEIILYISALLLVSCATPQMRAPSIDQDESAEEAENQVKYAFEKYFEQTTRVNKISTNIRMTNAYLCNDFLAPYYGFDVWTIDDFKNAKQLEKKVLRNTYQLRENIKIRYVDKGSPAFLSGLRFGDEIDEVNGKKISGGRTNVREEYQKIMEDNKGKKIDMKVWRKKEFINLSLKPVEACRSEIFVLFDSTINAFADGQNVYITRGMLNFIKNDLELATIISHEIAHNALHHIDAKKQNMTIAGIFGFVIDMTAAAYGLNTQGQFTEMAATIGSQAYSVEFEQEADYVSIYFLQNAGYDISKASDFWRRMAAESPDAIFIKTTHPTAPERFVGINKTVKEISRKLGNNKPLEPEIKISDKSHNHEHKKISTSDLKEESSKKNTGVSMNDCKNKNMDSCSNILENYMHTSATNLSTNANDAANIMKEANNLSSKNKLILYDFYNSKFINPEKDLSDQILIDLIEVNNQSAILRNFDRELKNIFISFNPDKKQDICTKLASLNSSNFSKKDTDTYSKLQTKCKD